MKKLHLGEQVTKMLSVIAALALPRVSDVGRPHERRFTEHLIDTR